MRIERHPIGVWVREDGCIYLPTSGKHAAHWTFGCKNNYGYLVVKVNAKQYRVHCLVAQAFLPNPWNKPQVDHLNRNRQDNRVENLSWATSSDNMRNTPQHDRVEARGGTHKYEDANQYERERGARHCKTHKNVRFSDGKRRWVTNEQALLLLALPVKDRIWKE